MDRLDRIAAVAGDAEDRQASKCPGEVVEEDVAGPERHRRANDRVTRDRRANDVLGLGLGAEVPRRRVGGSVDDADVDDAADPGGLRRVEERRDRLDGFGVGDSPALEADPVRRVERVDPLERARQLRGTWRGKQRLRKV